MALDAVKNLDFDDPPINHFEAKTRQEALQTVLQGKAKTASHNHVVNPLVHNAASHLIQNKKSLDIELYGFPYEVLERASSELEGAGISSKMASQAIQALEEYILNMGTDFSREARAKPLYARFKVTDREPKNLPECEQSQATFMDGMKSYGGDSARVIRYLSLFGSKSTTSQGVDMDAMFASKQTGLFVFFGSPSNEAVKGFDTIDNAMMNAMQGVGGTLSNEAMAELKEMIQNGEITPEALSLIENLAELAQLQEAILTPDAIENADAKLIELTQKILEQLAQGIAEGTIPQSIISTSVSILSDAGQVNLLSSIMDHKTIQDLIADNDNPEAADKIQTLIEKLSELSDLGAEDLLQLIQNLSEIENLPPEIQELLDKVDIDTLTPESLTEALSSGSESDLAQTVQSLIVTLNNPEIQSLLTPDTLNSVTVFLSAHESLVMAVSTQSVIQNLESVLKTISPNSPEVQSIQNIVEGLKAGTETISTIEPAIIQTVALQVNGAEFAILDRVLTTIDNAKSENIPLPNQAIETSDNRVTTPSANDNDSAPPSIEGKNIVGGEPTSTESHNTEARIISPETNNPASNPVSPPSHNDVPTPTENRSPEKPAVKPVDHPDKKPEEAKQKEEVKQTPKPQPAESAKPQNSDPAKPKLVDPANSKPTQITPESRANEQAAAIKSLGGTKDVSFTDSFNNASSVSQKINLIAEHGLKSIVKTFGRTCGAGGCGGCGACGQALQRVASTAIKPITGMKTILGLKPSNQNISDKLKVKIRTVNNG